MWVHHHHHHYHQHHIAPRRWATPSIAKYSIIYCGFYNLGIMVLCESWYFENFASRVVGPADPHRSVKSYSRGYAVCNVDALVKDHRRDGFRKLVIGSNIFCIIQVITGHGPKQLIYYCKSLSWTLTEHTIPLLLLLLPSLQCSVEIAPQGFY